MSTTKPRYTCGASIDGPKVGYRVVAWRKTCKQPVSGPGERCRFHGKVCPGCGQSLYLAPGYTHACTGKVDP